MEVFIWTGVLLTILICLVVVQLIKSLIFNRTSGLKHPPGPWTLPVLGYMPLLAVNPQEQLLSLSKKYGAIYTIHLGSYRVVVLNNYEVIRHAFKEEVFSGRPVLKMFEIRNGGLQRGLVCSQGKQWLEQRKFTMRHLRELGFGKQSMEGLLANEVQELICGLSNKTEEPIDLQDTLNLAVLNALWSIICGERYNHDDQYLRFIMSKTSADLAETQYTGPLLFLPWMIKVAPRLTRWYDFLNSIRSVHAFLQEIIEAHKKKFNSHEPRDFIDDYLQEIQNTTDTNSTFHKDVGEKWLLVVLLDLFMAGADTTSTTLYWGFLYMVLNKDVQCKVQEEIDLIVGDASISLEHRKKMPYTEATILEILRKSTLVPLGLFHSAMADTKLLGYDIPKDTVVIANLHCLNYDEAYWGDPHNFRPERFLKNNELIKHDQLIPFLIGRRACPGEILARDQLFLFLAGLLQRFTFSPDTSKPPPSQKPRHGIILTPSNYSVIVTKRLNKQDITNTNNPYQ